MYPLRVNGVFQLLLGIIPGAGRPPFIINLKILKIKSNKYIRTGITINLSTGIPPMSNHNKSRVGWQPPHARRIPANLRFFWLLTGGIPKTIRKKVDLMNTFT